MWGEKYVPCLAQDCGAAAMLLQTVQNLYLRPFSSCTCFAVQAVPSRHSTKQHAQRYALWKQLRPQARSHGITEPCQQLLRHPQDLSCPVCPVRGQGRLNDQLAGDCKSDVICPYLQAMVHSSIASTPSHRWHQSYHKCTAAAHKCQPKSS